MTAYRLPRPFASLGLFPRLALLAVGVTAAVLYLHFIGIEGDTRSLVQENAALASCFRQGSWGNCPNAGSFPLLQRIPASMLALLGFKPGLIVRGLACLSLASFFVMTRRGFVSLRRLDRDLSLVWMAVLLSGPVLYYARSSFSEMLAAAFTLGLGLCAFEDRAWPWIFGFSALAGLSKETAPPFLLVLVCVANGFRSNPKRFSLSISTLLAAMAGLLLSVSLNSALNLFRFGSIINQVYWNPSNFAPTLKQHLTSFFGLWLSPQGGLVFFGFGTFAMLSWLGWKCIRSRSIASGASGCLLLIWASMSWGFAKWYAPFGWIAWGPRLMIPWIPTTTFVTLAVYREEWKKLVSGLRRNFTRRILLVSALGLLSVPNYSALFNPKLTESLFEHDEVCPNDVTIDGNPSGYYHCLNHVIWPSPGRILTLQAYSPAFDPLAFVLSVFCAGTLASWLLAEFNPEEDQPIPGL